MAAAYNTAIRKEGGKKVYQKILIPNIEICRIIFFFLREILNSAV